MEYTDPKYFSLTDQVIWRTDQMPVLAKQMEEKYGEGPFRIVGLHLLHNPSTRIYPVAVTIEFADKNRQSFAGQWFKKV